MIDFTSIRRDTLLGRLLRAPLAWLPSGMVVPVLQGRLRGARWVVGSGVHGCWLGSYERDKQVALARCLRPGHVFYDIGANVGFYTLLAARRVGPSGRVHAFEPVHENLSFLRRHIALNRAENVTVHTLAISEEKATAKFVRLGSSVGHLDPDGDLDVEVRAIDDLVALGLEPPDVMKMDIEGAEAKALRGARATLREHRPIVFVATHGPDVHLETVDLLTEAKYRVTALGGGPPETDELLAIPEF